MSKPWILAGAIAGLFGVTSVQASENIQYSHLDVGVAHAELDAGREDATGGTVRLRAALTPNWFIAAEATRIDGTIERVTFGGMRYRIDAQAQLIGAGVGYALHASERLSYYGQVNVLHAEATAVTPMGTNYTADAFGQEARLGVRYMPTPRLELEASARHQAFGDELDSDTFLVAGGHVFLTDSLGLGLEGQLGSENQQLAATLRLRF